MADSRVAAVVIGRNEGARLAACLDSLAGQVARVVYVDSGSTDGSVSVAQAAGAEVTVLDSTAPFTAARARNEGVARLGEGYPYVQFVDGDCTVDPGWIETGLATLERDERVAVVCGRRREVAPEASVYNRMIDGEWATPIGPARACGGDALMRLAAFRQAGGFDPAMIAGEEPDLCIRLRRKGWHVLRLDAPMTRHDARMARFSQFWARARRAGYAFALGAARHGARPERHYVPELRRALAWGIALPVVAVALALAVSPWGLALLAAYPAQIIRLWRRDGDLPVAALLTVGKFAEAQGALSFLWDRTFRRAARIIEYK